MEEPQATSWLRLKESVHGFWSYFSPFFNKLKLVPDDASCREEQKLETLTTFPRRLSLNFNYVNLNKFVGTAYGPIANLEKMCCTIEMLFLQSKNAYFSAKRMIVSKKKIKTKNVAGSQF